MLDAISAGLIAGGAVVLLLTLIPTDPPWPNEVERVRREENARVAAALAAVATFAGALLLLVPAETRLASLPAAVGVAAAAYVVFVVRIHRKYVWMRNYVTAAFEHAGVIAVEIAQLYGVAKHLATDGGLGQTLTVSEGEATEVLRRACARSRWSWALRHPLGASNCGM